MKNAIHHKGALLLFLLTLLFTLFVAPALRAQTLFEEDFDDFTFGVLPPSWPIQGDGNVFSARACGGNAYEMNAFNGNPLPGFGTPKINRGNAPGNVVLTFDYRIEDWNDNTQLSGTGNWAVFLNQSQLFSEAVAFTDGCGTRTLTFTSFDIGLGTEFDFQFVADWTTGDWGFSVDNISVTLLNDGCRQAVELTQTDVRPGVLTTPTDGTFVGATPSGLPNCTGTANDDVWYKFTATERSVGVSVAGGDVVVELYEGGCGALNSLVCRDAFSVNEFFSYHGTTPGEEYHVRVYTFDGAPLDPAESTFRIQIGTPQAVNDECVSATPVQQSANWVCSSSEVSGSLERATDSGLATCAGTANDDVWYEFQATDPEVAFSITGGDVVVELFSGECGNLNSLNCVDEFFSGEEFSIDDAIVGDTYYLRIHSFGGTALTGSAAEFTLCIFTPCPLDPPSNLSVSNVTATTADLSHSYEFLEPRTEVVVLRGASPFGSTVYERSSVVCCFPATGLNPATDYDYYVLTDCTGSIATGPVPFSTKQQGDECVDAFSLTQSSATSYGTNLTQGTVEGATSSLAGCTGTANDDVWYSFEATNTDFSVFLESGDFVVQLFTGSCGNLTALVCEDGILVNETFAYSGATIGQTYYLRVYSFGGTPLTGADAAFGICVFTTPAVPANDACANAVNLPVNPSTTCASPTSGTTNGADRTETDPLCSGINGLASVWYSFTATSSAHLVTLSNVNIL
ncbi:MAG: fibronectin type III domain-containing protein, partial [Bacteroidota bacterium]